MDKKHIRDNYEIYNWKRIIQLMNYEKIIEIYNVRNTTTFYRCFATDRILCSLFRSFINSGYFD